MAIVLSLPFGPVFGATLVMLNWRALGEGTRAAHGWAWICAGAAAMALLVLAPPLVGDPEVDVNLSRLMLLGVTAAWALQQALPQVDVIRRRLARHYTEQGWALPVGIGCAAWAAGWLLARVG
ncbi:MAG: hypothetical protein JNN18_22950 [Rubrivivax sp.]|nr:hypothetical protein [Rubrivivax sp.]